MLSFVTCSIIVDVWCSITTDLAVGISGESHGRTQFARFCWFVFVVLLFKKLILRFKNYLVNHFHFYIICPVVHDNAGCDGGQRNPAVILVRHLS